MTFKLFPCFVSVVCSLTVRFGDGRAAGDGWPPADQIQSLRCVSSASAPDAACPSAVVQVDRCRRWVGRGRLESLASSRRASRRARAAEGERESSQRQEADTMRQSHSEKGPDRQTTTTTEGRWTKHRSWARFCRRSECRCPAPPSARHEERGPLAPENV
jgi:hypothetical protein